MTADFALIPVDLAREADFSLGSLRVRPSLRQAGVDGALETLEPRIVQVLVALTQRRGEVVSRDELIQRCWGGRVVGDDAISRVIARVRKLGETHQAFELETIPRVGYRLLPLAEGEASAPTASPAGDAPSADAAAPRRPLLKNPTMWAAIGGGLALVLLAVILFRPPASPDVEQVIARLTEKLQEERGPRDAVVSSNAVRALGRSGRAEERSAFEALASDDGEHALDILESLAKQLEASGDRNAASEAYGRLGAIATMFDSMRALIAQRKAFELNPRSLRSFQNLFFIHFFTRDFESQLFAEHVLADPAVDERMRGWVLSHLAFIQVDHRGEIETAEETAAKIKALSTFATDPVLQAAAGWADATIAFGKGDLPRAQTLAQAASDLWSEIPEHTSNSAEVVMLRAMFERGDWSGFFRLAAEAFDRRSRQGDLLPGMIIWQLCETALFTGQIDRALPYCSAAVRRAEGHPASVKGYTAIVAVLEGDLARAKREFAAAHGIIPSGGSIPGMILVYEAWAAHRAGDIAEAERLLAQKPGGRSWEEATRRRPAVLATARRLHGQWLIAAGQPRRACAPLAEARRVYLGYGGEAGAEAVRTLEVAANCPKA